MKNAFEDQRFIFQFPWLGDNKLGEIPTKCFISVTQQVNFLIFTLFSNLKQQEELLKILKHHKSF